PEPLTERELEILRLMSEGASNKEIAARLHLSGGTVRWYTQQIYVKLDAHSRYKAIERARQLQLLGMGRAANGTPAPQPSTATVEGSLVASPELVNPYKGLRAFQESDAETFFGRAGLTEQLLAHLSENGEGMRFLPLVGPSGSGKSSVV